MADSAPTHPAGEELNLMSSKPKGIAARAGHWSARHRKTAIFGWLALIVLSAVIGGMLGQKTPTNAEKMDGETRRAETILQDAGFPKKSGEMVLVQSKTQTTDDRAFKATIADVARTVAKQPVVANVTTDTVSEDGHSALVQFDLKGDPETATERVGPVLAATEKVAERHPKLTVEQFGEASMTKQLEDAAAKEESASNVRSLV